MTDNLGGPIGSEVLLLLQGVFPLSSATLSSTDRGAKLQNEKEITFIQRRLPDEGVFFFSSRDRRPQASFPFQDSKVSGARQRTVIELGRRDRVHGRKA